VRLLASNGALTRTYIRTGLTFLGIYTVLYGITQWIEVGWGFSSEQAGLLMLPLTAVSVVVTRPVSGRNLVRGPLIVAGISLRHRLSHRRHRPRPPHHRHHPRRRRRGGARDDPRRPPAHVSGPGPTRPERIEADVDGERRAVARLPGASLMALTILDPKPALVVIDLQGTAITW